MGSPDINVQDQHISTSHSCVQSAKAVRHRREFDEIILYMQSGVEVRIPRKLIPQLADTTVETIEQGLALSADGTWITLAAIDAEIKICDLLQLFFF